MSFECSAGIAGIKVKWFLCISLSSGNVNGSSRPEKASVPVPARSVGFQARQSQHTHTALKSHAHHACAGALVHTMHIYVVDLVHVAIQSSKYLSLAFILNTPWPLRLRTLPRHHRQLHSAIYSQRDACQAEPAFHLPTCFASSLPRPVTDCPAFSMAYIHSDAGGALGSFTG